MALENLKNGKLRKPLPVITEELECAIEDLIRLSLADHHQQLTRELLPRRGRGGAEELLAEDGSRRPSLVDLEQVFGLEPVLEQLGPAGVTGVARERGGKEDGAAEERLGARVQFAEEDCRGQVQAPCALAESNHLVWVSAVMGDVCLDPLEGSGDVLGAVGMVAALQGQAICDKTCDEAVAGEVIA